MLLAGRKWNWDAVFIEMSRKPATRLTLPHSPPAILLCYLLLLLINPAPVHMYLTQNFYILCSFTDVWAATFQLNYTRCKSVVAKHTVHV